MVQKINGAMEINKNTDSDNVDCGVDKMRNIEKKTDEDKHR